MVLRAPSLDKRHPDGAHLGQLVHGLEPVVDGLGEQGGKLLVVEDLEATTRWDLAHLAKIICNSINTSFYYIQLMKNLT